MPRLGELLVAAGLLTVEQVEHALRAQVMWGGRLGTNLVELHHLELDALSKVLGRQHHLPAALARHFEKADPALQRLLSPDFAERFSCLPLLRMGPERHVVIVALAPLLPRQLAIIADELAVGVERLVPAIAPELRIRYQLERIYNIRRAARFLRARGNSVPPFPAFQVVPAQPDPDGDLLPSLPTSTRELDAFQPHGAPGAPSPQTGAMPVVPTDDLHGGGGDGDAIPVEIMVPRATATGPLARLAQAAFDDDFALPSGPAETDARGRERRTYVRTIADAPSSESERQALLGRIAIRKVAVGSAPRVMAGATLGEATRAIRRSTGRDRVADLVIDTLDRFAPACEAAILLVIRGATAIGWKGFQRGGSGGLGEIAVPMEHDGLVPRAVELNVTLRQSSAQLDAIDALLLASLGRTAGDLVVVPIAIGEQVMCVVALATAQDAPITAAEPIAAAAGAAFARLMRDASR